MREEEEKNQFSNRSRSQPSRINNLFAIFICQLPIFRQLKNNQLQMALSLRQRSGCACSRDSVEAENNKIKICENLFFWAPNFVCLVVLDVASLLLILQPCGSLGKLSITLKDIFYVVLGTLAPPSGRALYFFYERSPYTVKPTNLT